MCTKEKVRTRSVGTYLGIYLAGAREPIFKLELSASSKLTWKAPLEPPIHYRSDYPHLISIYFTTSAYRNRKVGMSYVSIYTSTRPVHPKQSIDAG